MNTPLNDLTHNMFDPKWNGQFSQKSQDFYYLFLLKPLVERYNLIIPPPQAPQSLIATLTRNSDTTYKETVGQLVVGNWNCRTLELPWLNNQQNISCVPTGTYLCKYQFMWRELAYRYCLQAVPNRTGIYFHGGNFATGKKIDTKGCILLGASYNDLDGNGTPDIVSTNLIVTAFEKLLNGKDFTLIIK